MMQLFPALAGISLTGHSGRIVDVASLAAALSSGGLPQVSVARSLQGKLVYVESSRASNTEICGVVATALHATLKRTKNGFTLERTPEDLLQIRKGRAVERAKWLHTRMEGLQRYRSVHLDPNAVGRSVELEVTKFSTQLDDVSHGHGNTISPFRATQLLPSEVLLEGIVNRIGIAELASVPSGEIRVYEDIPTLGGKPLPVCDDLVSAYYASMRRLESVRLSDQTKARAGTVGMADVLQLGTTSTDAVRFRVQLQSSANLIDIDLEGFDAQGKRVTHAWLSAGPTEQLLSSSLLFRQAASKTDSHWEALSQSAIEALRFLSRPPTSSAAPDWFLNPDRHEPLNAFVSEALGRICAESQPKCVVVDVSDSLWTCVRRSSLEGRLNLEALQSIVDQSIPYQRMESNSAVIWRPIDPEYDEKTRADRKVLGRFARNIKMGIPCSLRTSGILFHDASPEWSPLAGIWLSCAESGVPSALSGRGNFSDSCLRLVGSLSDDEWGRLLIGKPLPASEVGAEAALAESVKNDPMLKVSGDSPFPDIYCHASELYTDTPISSTPLSVRSVSTQVVRWWKLGDEAGDWHPSSQLASLFTIPPAAVHLNRDSETLTMQRDEFERQFEDYHFRIGTQMKFIMTIWLPTGLYIRCEAPENLTSEQNVYAYSDFPDSYRANVWKIASNDVLQFVQQIRKGSTTPPQAPPKTVPPPLNPSLR